MKSGLQRVVNGRTARRALLKIRPNTAPALSDSFWRGLSRLNGSSAAIQQVTDRAERTAHRNLALVERGLLRCSSPLGRMASAGAFENRPAARYL